jgi:hypothetical protein
MLIAEIWSIIVNKPKTPYFEMIKLFFLPIADSESITTLNCGHSAIRKDVSLAMGLSTKELKNFYLEPPDRLHAPPQIWYRSVKENFFFHFCYLNLLEHEKCSEICVWIVGFGQILRKCDCFK